MVIGIITSVPITVSSASSSDIFVNVYDDPIENESEFNIDKDGNITKYCGTSTSVIIPLKVQGKKVTGIGKGCFKDSRIKSIHIPDIVTYIGDYAFENCTSLSSVSFASNLTPITIGNCVFKNCDALREITIPAAVSVGQLAFDNCTYLKKVVFSKGTLSLGSYCFSNCRSLESVTIPESTKNIGTQVFDCCDKEKLVIITPIGSDAENYALAHGFKTSEIGSTSKNHTPSDWIIDIEPTCTQEGSKHTVCVECGCELVEPIPIVDHDFVNNYCVNCGAIYGFQYIIENDSITITDYTEEDKCIVIPSTINGLLVKTIGENAFSNCTYLETITIPDSVTNIGDGAFRGCGKLLSITIPNGIKYISRWTFYECTNLKSVIIPDSIVDVKGYAFEKCINLTDIYYSGSINQWRKMLFSEYNESLFNATIHFDYGTEPPATPKLTSASRVSNGVKVSWNAVKGADEYIVYRKTSKSGWTRLGVVTSTSFTDTKAKTGTTYYYTVKAQNEAGTSGYNKTGLKIKYVAAPKLTKIANESSGVRVYWSKVSGADGYYLYRRVAGSKTWTKVATIKKGSTTSYLDKKASVGKTYEYIIKCYDGSTPSAAAAKVIKIKRLASPKISSASSKYEGILVKWNKVSGASGYYVYRKATSGEWKRIDTVKGNTKIKYLDETPRKGATYQYIVRAYSGFYTSGNSNAYKIKCKH